jgi:hypothetical protein
LTVVAQAAEGEKDEEPRPDAGGEDETVRYINPDTGETREYPARLAPRKPDGWIDTRDLPDPNKPMFFEPLGGVGDGEEPVHAAGSGATPNGRPTFASDELLAKHFEDHGSDFGAVTESEYADQAAQFLGDQDSPAIIEFVRTKGYRRGDTVRFNPNTDEFGVVSQDGRIRTYYRPDPELHGFPTNLDYFNSEKEKADE